MSEPREQLTAAIAEIMQAVDQVHKAFGAPGDYGYDTTEGKALIRLYRAQVVLAALAEEQP